MISAGDPVFFATAGNNGKWPERSVVKTAADFIKHEIYTFIHSSNTHVSLLPPPCEELTTSEPFFNATRVNPPGMIVTSSP